MQVSIDNVGVVIAYVAPGAIAILGASSISSTLRSWLHGSEKGPTVGGAFLLLVAALSAGLFADALAKLVIEPIHHATGIVRPPWDYAALVETRFPQFEGIVQNEFRYHQFYANTFLCLLFAWLVSRRPPYRPQWRDLGVLALLALAWLASREALGQTYEAIAELLSASAKEGVVHGK